MLKFQIVVVLAIVSACSVLPDDRPLSINVGESGDISVVAADRVYTIAPDPTLSTSPEYLGEGSVSLVSMRVDGSDVLRYARFVVEFEDTTRAGGRFGNESDAEVFVTIDGYSLPISELQSGDVEVVEVVSFTTLFHEGAEVGEYLTVVAIDAQGADVRHELTLTADVNASPLFVIGGIWDSAMMRHGSDVVEVLGCDVETSVVGINGIHAQVANLELVSTGLAVGDVSMKWDACCFAEVEHASPESVSLSGEQLRGAVRIQ